MLAELKYAENVVEDMMIAPSLIIEVMYLTHLILKNHIPHSKMRSLPSHSSKDIEHIFLQFTTHIVTHFRQTSFVKE